MLSQSLSLQQRQLDSAQATIFQLRLDAVR
jgi:hypothetical protein